MLLPTLKCLLLLLALYPCSSSGRERDREKLDINRLIKNFLRRFAPPAEADIRLTCPAGHSVVGTAVYAAASASAPSYPSSVDKGLLFCVVCQHNVGTEQLEVCQDRGFFGLGRRLRSRSRSRDSPRQVLHRRSFPGRRVCGMTFSGTSDKSRGKSLFEFLKADMCGDSSPEKASRQGHTVAARDAIWCPAGQLTLHGVLIYPIWRATDEPAEAAQSAHPARAHVCGHCLQAGSYPGQNSMNSTPGVLVCRANATRWPSDNKRVYKCLEQPCMFGSQVNSSLNDERKGRKAEEEAKVKYPGREDEDYAEDEEADYEYTEEQNEGEEEEEEEKEEEEEEEKYCGFKYDLGGPRTDRELIESLELTPCLSSRFLGGAGAEAAEANTAKAGFRLDPLHFTLLTLTLALAGAVAFLGRRQWRAEKEGGRKSDNFEFGGGKSADAVGASPTSSKPFLLPLAASPPAPAGARRPPQRSSRQLQQQHSQENQQHHNRTSKQPVLQQQSQEQQQHDRKSKQLMLKQLSQEQQQHKQQQQQHDRKSKELMLQQLSQEQQQQQQQQHDRKSKQPMQKQQSQEQQQKSQEKQQQRQLHQHSRKQKQQQQQEQQQSKKPKQQQMLPHQSQEQNQKQQQHEPKPGKTDTEDMSKSDGVYHYYS